MNNIKKHNDYNKILVQVQGQEKAILKYPKCNIEINAYIGRNGTTKRKQEGDGKTPLGEFELGAILGTQIGIQNKNKLKYRKISKEMYWVDDIKSRYYNKLVNENEVEKDWNSAEHLIEYPKEYEYLIEIKTNPQNIPGKGSAVFLHCSNNKSTAGCVAIDAKSMRIIIENIDKDTKIEINRRKEKMSTKQDNEITLKIKGNLDEFYKDIEYKGFKIVHEFSMDDTYFVPKILNLKEMSTREILSKAVLVRKIIGKTSGKISQKITFKMKEFDENGNILKQDAINCEVLDIQKAKELLKAIGYEEIMNIKEDDRVYENTGLRFAVKDIRNGDNLIEAEIGENEDVNTVEELVEKVANFKIPVCFDDYFVKKAEIELDKVLGRE